MHVFCAQCRTPYELGPEYAGKKVRCRTCQAVIQVPMFDPSAGAAAPGSQAGAAAEPGPYRSPAATAGAQHPYGADRAAAFETHRKLVGIFNIIVGILSLLWAGLWGFVVFAVAMAGQEMHGRGDPPPEVVSLFYLVAAALALAGGIIQLAAGTKVLKGSPGARNMGLFAGFLSCASLWGCCVYPFCLASGIYTLIILFGQDAKSFLEVRRRRF